MEMVPVVVLGQCVLVASQAKLAIADPIAIASDDRSKVRRISKIAFEVIKTEDNIF